MKLVVILSLSALVAASWTLARSRGDQKLTVQDVLKWPPVPADHRVMYGSDPLQFGELRLPEGHGPHPVAIIIHGGCWLSSYKLDQMGNLSAALTRDGIATWSLEYRRVGDNGGGWPGTFQDIAQGTDYLRVLAKDHPLDLNRVVVVGHSAGGHLALWAAARRHLPRESALFSSDPLPLTGVVSLAGVPDLSRFRGKCDDAAGKVLGGSPESMVTARYKEASPIELLPLGVPQRLIHGTSDSIVPPALARDYERAAQQSGDEVKLILVEGAAHFEVIAPQSSAWPAIEEAALSLLKLDGSRKQ